MGDDEIKSLSSLVEETEEAKAVAQQLKEFFSKEIQRVRDSRPDQLNIPNSVDSK